LLGEVGIYPLEDEKEKKKKKRQTSGSSSKYGFGSVHSMLPK